MHDPKKLVHASKAGISVPGKLLWGIFKTRKMVVLINKQNENILVKKKQLNTDVNKFDAVMLGKSYTSTINSTLKI